jgi:hypothetical protein
MLNSVYYILDEHGNPVPEPDVRRWSEWFNKCDKHVAEDMIGEIRVSTVFLGIDHSFGGPPLLFETMIFGGEHDGYQQRYINRQDGLEGHIKAVVLVQQKDQL